jgi:hypothetical protein
VGGFVTLYKKVLNSASVGLSHSKVSRQQFSAFMPVSLLPHEGQTLLINLDTFFCAEIRWTGFSAGCSG